MSRPTSLRFSLAEVLFVSLPRGVDQVLHGREDVAPRPCVLGR